MPNRMSEVLHRELKLVWFICIMMVAVWVACMHCMCCTHCWPWQGSYVMHCACAASVCIPRTFQSSSVDKFRHLGTSVGTRVTLQLSLVNRTPVARPPIPHKSGITRFTAPAEVYIVPQVRCAPDPPDDCNVHPRRAGVGDHHLWPLPRRRPRHAVRL